MSKSIKVQTGDKFNRLTIIKEMPCIKKDRRVFVKCDCGNEKEVSLYKLLYNKCKSCGCLVKDVSSLKKLYNRSEYYTLVGTRIYKIWIDMRSRCKNENVKYYSNYGGRGIRVCEEWDNSFIKFYNWALLNQYNDKLTIDRIDVNGNYEPSNCRWATKYEQSLNTTRSKFVFVDGVKYSLIEASLKFNIELWRMRQRLKRGFAIEEILNENYKRRIATKMNYNGVEITVKEAAKISGLSKETIIKRIRMDFAVDEILRNKRYEGKNTQ